MSAATQPPDIETILAEDPAPSSMPPRMPDGIVAEHMERCAIIARLADEVLERRAEQRLLEPVEARARALLRGDDGADDGLLESFEALDAWRALRSEARR